MVSRRWALFLVVVIVLAWGAVQLGEWQFRRLEQRRDRNAQIERNESLPPAPVADVLKVGTAPAAEQEWRVVEAVGTYAAEDTVIVRYRTNGGEPGVQAVVPLVLADGAAVLVDRGWWPTANRGEVPDDLPDPPSGEVTITGWVRLDATGDSTKVTDQSTRAISSSEIGAALQRDLYGGFVSASSESPEPHAQLTRTELPELNEGPHFFYGLQWWFFGALAVFGFCYLLFDEWRDRKRERQQPGSQAPAEPGEPAS